MLMPRSDKECRKTLAQASKLSEAGTRSAPLTEVDHKIREPNKSWTRRWDIVPQERFVHSSYGPLHSYSFKTEREEMHFVPQICFIEFRTANLFY